MEALSSENITLTSLKDIYDNKKVLGEILGIEGEWYFNACKNKVCGKKLQDCTDKMYCKVDDDQDGPLVLWDNVCLTLLGVTASELKEKYSKVVCMPNEIEDLIGKTMMYRIVTRNDQFKYSGNVSKMRKALDKEAPSRPETDVLIMDCLSLIRQLHDFKLTHTFREGNHCPDRLANMGHNGRWGTTLLALPPDEIKGILDHDAKTVAARRIF
nr:replication protein A 70 kDa DNA-binding subunit B-like [Ipomoea batatas]